MKKSRNRLRLYQENHWYQDYSQVDFNPNQGIDNLGHPIQGKENIESNKKINDTFLSIKEFFSNKKLLSIGTGYGNYEIPITPILKSISFVEPDKNSCEYLRQTLSHINHATVFQKTMNEFMDSNNEIFDIILTINPSHWSSNPFYISENWFSLMQQSLSKTGVFILQKHYGSCYKHGLVQFKYTLNRWIAYAKQNSLNLTVIGSFSLEHIGHCYIIFSKTHCPSELLELKELKDTSMKVFVENNTIIHYKRYSILDTLIHLFFLSLYIPYSMIKGRNWKRELKVNLALIFT